MEVVFKKTPGHNYMILSHSIPEGEYYVVQMLCDNQIPGLMPVSVERMNGKQTVRYEITSMQSMSTLFARRGMNGTDIFRVLEGLQEAYESTGAYLLNPSDIVPDPELIYMDPETRRIRLCYVPGYEEKEGSAHRYAALAEFMLRHLQHEDHNAVELAYGFYEGVSRENVSYVQLISQLLQGCDTSVDRSMDAGRYVDAGSYMGENVHAGNAAGAVSIPGAAPTPAPSIRRDAGGGRYADRNAKTGMPGMRAGAAAQKFGRHMSANPEEDKEQDMALDIDAEAFLQETNPGRKKRSFPGKDKAEKKHLLRMLFLVFGLAALYAVLVYFLRLDLTQMGGLFFLFAAVTWLVYGTVTGRREKNRNHWSEDVEETDDEEAFIQQLMSEVYDMSGQNTSSQQDLFRQPAFPAKEDGSASVFGRAVGTAGSDGSAGSAASPGGSGQGDGSYGSTRILLTGADMPDITLVSDNIRYQNLKPVGSESLIGKQTDRVDLGLPNHDAVSRIHAKLECSQDGIFLTDLNSTNGTWVNGHQISERTRLHNGDRISFAGLGYRVRINEL